jgi:hypothetical protein
MSSELALSLELALVLAAIALVIVELLEQHRQLMAWAVLFVAIAELLARAVAL